MPETNVVWRVLCAWCGHIDYSSLVDAEAALRDHECRGRRIWMYRIETTTLHEGRV